MVRLVPVFSLPAREINVRSGVQPHAAVGRLSRRDNMEKTMIRLIAFAAFALAVATSAHAMSPAPLRQADGMITQVREACGAGMHMVNGTCMRTATRRNAARCAVGMRTVGGRCVK